MTRSIALPCFIGFCVFILALLVGTDLFAGPGPIPFYPTFVTGSGSTNCQPTNQLCFNTVSSPYTAYVWNPLVPAWEQYGGSGGGSSCSASAGDILYSVAGTDCTGTTLVWNGSQLVWATSRTDDPGDIITTGGFNLTVGGGGNIQYHTGLDISSTTGTLQLGGTNVNISAGSGNVVINGSSITVNGSALGFFATATTTTATAALNLFTSSIQGLVPASGGGTTNFLRADGTWAATSGSTVTWPTSGSVVVSNSTNSPTGVAEADGKVLVGQTGAWAAGNVPVSSVSGALCISTAGAVQYNNSGVAGCAPLIIATSGPHPGEMQFTGSRFGLNGADWFYLDGNSNFDIDYNSMTNISSGQVNFCEGHLACNQITSGSTNYAFGWEALYNNQGGNFNVGIGPFAGYDITSGSGNLILGPGGEGSTALTTGSNNIVIQAPDTGSSPGTQPPCSMSSSSVNNELDICGNGATDTLPILRCNLVSIAAGSCAFNVPVTLPAGSTTTPPGGISGQVQYNNSGAFGGLTNTQLTADINTFTSSLSGAAPASGGGTANFLRADGSWASPLGATAAILVNTAPQTPTGPTSTSALSMMGLGGTCTITPAKSGTVMFTIEGTIKDGALTAAGDGIAYQISYGTGTAPTNGTGATGTQVVPLQTFEEPVAITTAADVNVPFTQIALVTGLTIGTPYWFDLAAKDVGSAASGFNLSTVSCNARE